MPRIAYVNGSYRPYPNAAVHIDDRGYQFADAVYEVIAVNDGRLIDLPPHLRRLERSLRELKIIPPMSDRALGQILERVVRINRVRNGLVYLQISRGVAPRDHVFPIGSAAQLVITARHKKPLSARLFEEGVSVITIDDIRWGRCDIKSTSLLANVLGKQTAKEAGAYEAWQIADGNVTEGTSCNAWIVTAEGILVTRPPENEILNGITRQIVLELTKTLSLRFEERAFSLIEARAANEAFITGTTAYVLPVTRLDGKIVGDGMRGPVTKQLQQSYAAHIDRALSNEGVVLVAP